MGQQNGIVIGIVADLSDPENLGRVRVRYPHLGDELSDWAYLASPMAGKDRGLFFRPEVDDQVLVAFVLGDPKRPYVIGSLWSDSDQPPPQGGSASDNNWRIIKSRSGHIVKLNDTQGSESIEIIDKDGQRKVVIDSANQKIQVTADSGDIEVTSTGGQVTVQANEITIKSSGNMTIEAGGTLNITGAVVNINS